MKLTISNPGSTFFKDCNAVLCDLKHKCSANLQDGNNAIDLEDQFLMLRQLLFIAQTMWENCADPNAENLQVRPELLEAWNKIHQPPAPEDSTETFTDVEAALLAPYFTNLDRSIFGLRNLPEVVKGALFSRYSRSEKSLRRILLDEFINAPEANFQTLAGGVAAQSDVAVAKAEAFYDRVLIGYGDDSVAELGGAHLACEGISNIAAKVIEDSRLGISPLEKSTRYVAFNQKVNGRYLYCLEPSIMASAHADRYVATLDYLFDTYTTLHPLLLAWVKRVNPKEEQVSDRAYLSATRAKTFDLLRGLLPMATLTNVGLFGNGRAFEYLLVKMAASAHPEINQIGEVMQEELDQTIPSFVKRAKTDRGRQYAQYMAESAINTSQIAKDLMPDLVENGSAQVVLAKYDPAAEINTVAAILYPRTTLSYPEVKLRVGRFSISQCRRIIETYVGDRASRFQRPGRAFEEIYYTFDILADIGAYRDLHRHRVLTQERQSFTTRHGYITPTEIETAGLAEIYREAMDRTAVAFEEVAKDFPIAAQYMVPFACLTRWRIKLNLREAYHFIELRSARQGHPTYRRVAQDMYRLICAVHPSLASPIMVDMEDYQLERLGAEQRLDEKIGQGQ
jgi:thymidylate synthase ThyX